MSESAQNPVLDLEVVESLKELDNGDGSNLFLELVDLFIEDAASQIASMSSALAGGDTNTLERAAHTLKSSCANIGAMRMSQLCLELEKLGRAGRLEGAGELVQRAQVAYREVCTRLAEVRS